MTLRRLSLTLSAALLAGCLAAEPAPVKESIALKLDDMNGWNPAEIRLNDPGETMGGPRKGVREMNVAVNPTNPQNIIVAAMDYNTLNLDPTIYGGTRLWRSFDAGRTWQGGELYELYHGKNPQRYYHGDPTIVFDRRGVAYLGLLGTIEGTPGGIYVIRSTDGGVTWDAPRVAVADVRDETRDECKSTDKELLAYDETPDRLYLAFTWFIDHCSTPGGQAGGLALGTLRAEAYLSHSDDQGATWSDPVLLRDSYTLGVTPRVDADGTLWVAMLSSEKTPVGTSLCPHVIGSLFREPFGAIAVLRSRDSGETWTTHLQGMCDSTALGAATKVAGARPPYPYQTLAPSIAIDPTTNAVYVAYITNRPAERRLTVEFIATTDGGRAWSAPVDATPGAPSEHRFLHAIAADNGTVMLLHMRSKADGAYAAFVQHSTDHGTTWSTPFRLNRPDYHLDDQTDLDIGHYNWIDTRGGVVAAAWSGGEGVAVDAWVRTGQWPMDP